MQRADHISEQSWVQTLLRACAGQSAPHRAGQTAGSLCGLRESPSSLEWQFACSPPTSLTSDSSEQSVTIKLFQASSTELRPWIQSGNSKALLVSAAGAAGFLSYLSGDREDRGAPGL